MSAMTVLTPRDRFRARTEARPLLADGGMGTLLYSRGIAQRACLDERPHALFEEQRIAFGPVEEQALEWSQRGVRPQQRRQQSIAALRSERIEPDLPVETAWPQQGRIEHIRAVRRRDHDHPRSGTEAVHLDEQLVERLLALLVGVPAGPAALPSDRIDLVDEDDAAPMPAGGLEEIPHA